MLKQPIEKATKKELIEEVGRLQEENIQDRRKYQRSVIDLKSKSTEAVKESRIKSDKMKKALEAIDTIAALNYPKFHGDEFGNPVNDSSKEEDILRYLQGLLL